MRKVAAVQSCYVPWKGYFDIINQVDVFVFHDCVQYTKQDWRNRNQILVNGKKRWLTIPIQKHAVTARVNEVEVDQGQAWVRRHGSLLSQAYGQAPFFGEVMDLMGPFLGDQGSASSSKSLSVLNQAMTRCLASYLGIKTKLVDSSELDLRGKGTDRLLDILEKLGGNSYLTGPKAKEYIEPEKFKEKGIELAYKDYSGYPEYPQFSKKIDHHVSILDLLFHVGPKASDYIWGWRS